MRQSLPQMISYDIDVFCASVFLAWYWAKFPNMFIFWRLSMCVYATMTQIFSCFERKHCINRFFIYYVLSKSFLFDILKMKIDFFQMSSLRLAYKCFWDWTSGAPWQEVTQRQHSPSHYPGKILNYQTNYFFLLPCRTFYTDEKKF